MGKERKDPGGNVLRKGEVYRKDKNLYSFAYFESGKRKYVYSKELNDLRDKVRELAFLESDSTVSLKSKSVTVEEIFNKYILSSLNRQTTKENYLCYYETYIKSICNYSEPPRVERAFLHEN